MYKRIIILLVILLCSSCKRSVYECYIDRNDIEIYSTIISNFNNIESISNRIVISVDEEIFLDEERLNNLLKQLDNYEIIDKKIVIDEIVELEKIFNLKESLKQMEKDGFSCVKN